MGPCSAWPEHAVIEYAKKAKVISDEVEDKILIVLRSYTQKPRSTVGWPGAINQPDPFKPEDIEAGIMYCRKMMIGVLEAGLPIADEALFTHNDDYFDDLLSWLAIGARSGQDQDHKNFASKVDVPIGMKNPTSGNLDEGVENVISAQHPHVYLLRGEQIRTDGNPYAHLLLRGGRDRPNYDWATLQRAMELMEDNNVQNPSIIVDASHGNSIEFNTGKKNPQLQPGVVFDVVDSMKRYEKLRHAVKGFMVESFLKPGNQKEPGKIKTNGGAKREDIDMGGLSITDACIGIEETRDFVKTLYERL